MNAAAIAAGLQEAGFAVEVLRDRLVVARHELDQEVTVRAQLAVDRWVFRSIVRGRAMPINPPDLHDLIHVLTVAYGQAHV